MIFKKIHGNIGRKRSPETIEKIRQANLGKIHSSETIEKMRQGQSTPEVKEKIRQAHFGKKHKPETIEKIRQTTFGRKRSPETIEKIRQANLNIFSALEKNITDKYCPLFNNEIRDAVRNRDDFTCQHCGKKQFDNHRKLSVHHIHYDKKNCFPDLITLCCSCNVKVNHNRDCYESFFMNKLNDRNLLLWTKCRNKQEY